MPNRSTVRAAEPVRRLASAAGLALLLAACGGVAAAPAGTGSAAPEAESSTSTSIAEAPPATATAPRTADPVATPSTVRTGADPAQDAAPGTALDLLATLDVKGRAPKTGYDRDRFGQRWADTDRNGCDTRNDMLRRDLTSTQVDPGTAGCLVLSGSLVDPFSGTTIAFLRGQSSSSDVQIDHVVALSDAWQKGAQQWTAEQRLAFANDPLNLLAVDGGLNGQKSDGDAATWLPPNGSFRCAYVARQVAVKARYGAWVTEAERAAIARVLADCPDEPVPAGQAPEQPAVSSASPSAPAPVAAPPPPPSPPPAAPVAPSCDASYPGVCIAPFAEVGDLDCGDVEPRRFAVVAPDPHGFDGEGDGMGCEG